MTRRLLIPRELEHWRGRQLQLATTAPIADVHMRLARLYSDQIAAIILG